MIRPTNVMTWTIDPATVFESTARMPRYERIAAAIETALERGDLRPGDRLPTVRALARQLRVSSASVAVAYSLLERRGRLDAQVGRGTFVRAAGARGRTSRDADVSSSPDGHIGTRQQTYPHEAARAWRRRVLRSGDRLRTINPGAIPCSSSWPDVSLLPIEALRRAYARAVDQLQPADLQYGGPEIDPTLADAILPRMEADGISARPEELLVVSSAGQLLTILLQLGPVIAGSRSLHVAVEEPGYHAAFNIIESHGHRLVGIETDNAGALPDSLHDALESGVQVVLFTPRAINPTGASWTAERRGALAEVLADFPRVLVIEDDHFSGAASVQPRSLTNDPRLADRTLYARSHSKAVAPDLRITVVLARGRLFGLLRDARLSDGGWSPRLSQRALAFALQNSSLDDAFATARVAYAERREAAIEALQSALPHAIVIHPTDGLNVWVSLPAGFDAEAVTEQAAHLGVLVASGEPFYVHPGRRDAVRLSVGRVDVGGARRGGELLARAILTADDVPLSLHL
jgi:GntR family transcriptional regulator / MocR family aminotransferase